MSKFEPKFLSLIKAFLFWAMFEGLFISGGLSFIFPMLPKWGVGIVIGSFIALCIFVMTFLFLKFDSLSSRDLGMVVSRGSFYRFIVSLLLGCACFGLLYLLYYLLTPVTVLVNEGGNILQLLIINVVLFTALGTMEELAFRGYLLKKLDDVVGSRFAIYITSFLFGMYHGISVESITGPAIWGLFYAVLAYWSKGLAIPIGFHIGLNLIQGLFSGKTKWVEGIWTFEVMDAVTPLSIEQLTLLIQAILLVSGLILVEYYLRVVRNKQNS